LILFLLILVSTSIYSQRIRIIGNDTFVTFTKEQAKAVNDTFISQRQIINKLKNKDSLNIIQLKNYQDSLQNIKTKTQTTVGWDGWLFVAIQGIVFIIIVAFNK
jgi:hypothetical protein